MGFFNNIRVFKKFCKIFPQSCSKGNWATFWTWFAPYFVLILNISGLEFSIVITITWWGLFQTAFLNPSVVLKKPEVVEKASPTVQFAVNATGKIALPDNNARYFLVVVCTPASDVSWLVLSSKPHLLWTSNIFSFVTLN